MIRNTNASVIVIVGISMFFLSLIIACGGGFRKPASIPVPEYRYPGIDSLNNLRLISVLTEPYGESFLQGSLRPRQAKGKNNLKLPFSTTAIGSDTLFLLDHARGIVYRLSFDTNGTIVNTTVYPRGRRRFPSLTDMSPDPEGNLWLVDSRLKSVFKIDKGGNIIDSISGVFERPVGITFQKRSGQMLITDLATNSIFAYSLDGNLVRKHNAASGLMVESPSFITTDDNGRVYVVEALTAFVKVFSSDWTLERSIGGLGDGPGYFAKPKGIAVDKMKRIYVADALFDNVQIFDSTGSLLLTLGTTGDRVGEFWQPTGLFIDEKQRLFISDTYNRRVQVFRWETGE